MAVSDKKPSGQPPKKAQATPKPPEPAKPPAKEAVAAAEPTRRPGKNYVLRRRIRSFIGFLGFLLVLVGAWIIYHWYVTDKPPDLGTERGRQEALGTLKDDAGKVAEKAKEFYSYSIEELEKRMKGKPPETKEEITALVKESQEDTKSNAPAEKTTDAQKTGAPSDPGITNLPSKKEEPALTGPFADANTAAQLGFKAYALTDPASSQEQVQVHVRIAKHYFERSLNYIDKARAGGVTGRPIDSLEEKVTKRLYDCKRRIELNKDYDRKGAEELKKWP